MKKLAMLAAVLLVAGTAMASNTGFKLNYDIPYDASTLNNVPVSLPYFYFGGGYPDRVLAVGCDLLFSRQIIPDGSEKCPGFVDVRFYCLIR